MPPRCRGVGGERIAAGHVGNHLGALPAPPERDAVSLYIAIRQLWKNVDLDALFGKTLCVLGQTEPVEPVRNFPTSLPQQSLRGETELATKARVYADCSATARPALCGRDRMLQYQIR
jgi:hypothetical protein